MQEITGPTDFTKCEKCGQAGWVKPDGTEMVDADFAEGGYIRYGAILVCRNCGNQAALKNPSLNVTEIALMVEIPIRGLSPAQATEKIKQKANAFHVAAHTRYARDGYNMKNVTLFPNEPGRATLHIRVPSHAALRLEKLLWELWEQTA
jgi:hypothetical protein